MNGCLRFTSRVRVIATLAILVTFRGDSKACAADPAASEPIPSIRPEIAALLREQQGLPTLAGYRWVYDAGGDREDVIECRTDKLEGGAEVCRLQASFDSFFWRRDLAVRNRNGSLVYVIEYEQSVEVPPGAIIPRPATPSKASRFEDDPNAVKRTTETTYRTEFRVVETPLFHSRMNVGDVWRYRTEDNDGAFSEEFDARVLSRKRIATPAGDFEAWCIEYSPVKPHTGCDSLLAWFAPEVGFVRFDEWTFNHSRRGSQVLEKTIRRLKRIETVKTPGTSIRSSDETQESASQPLSELPTYVTLVPGKLSLFADFGKGLSESVPIYVINDSAAPFEYVGYSGRITFFQQECRDQNGKWNRSTAQAVYPCGFGMGVGNLPPKSFQRTSAWQCAAGPRESVRYVLGGNVAVTSNEGIGGIDPKQLILARYDRLAIDPDNTFLKRTVNRGLNSLGLGDYSPFVPRPRIGYESQLTLPAGKERSILRQCYDSSASNDLNWLVMEGIQETDPAGFVNFVKAELRSSSPTRRQRMLSSAAYWQEIVDPEVDRILIALVGPIWDEETSLAISALRSLPNWADHLRTIADDETRSFDLRCAVELASNRPQLRDRPRFYVDLNEPFPGDHEELDVDVRITNTTDQTMTFEYASPQDLVKFIAVVRPRTWNDDDQPAFFPPRPGIQWFRSPAANAKTTVFEIPPHKSHEIRVNLGDLFDFGDQPACVWAYFYPEPLSCSRPHQIFPSQHDSERSDVPASLPQPVTSER